MEHTIHADTLLIDSPIPPSKPRTTSKLKQALLVLDGKQLLPALLSLAVVNCVRLVDRLDILLVNPPEAPIALLRVMLLRLEHAGIDYRLSSVNGDLGEQVLLYLKRHLGITTILIANSAMLDMHIGRDAMADMGAERYRLIAYADVERG